MSFKNKTFAEKIFKQAGWQSGLVTNSDVTKYKSNLSPFKKFISKIAFEDKNLNVDAVYFSGDYAFLYIKILEVFDPELVIKLQRKLWNEGRVPLLVIMTPTEIKVFDCYDIPADDSSSLKRLERESFKQTTTDIQRLIAILGQSKIDSGLLWKEQLGKNITIGNRVDKQLLKSLSNARKKLFNEYKIPLKIIHDLLGRSLFTLYLEDRNILQYLAPTKFTSFFDSLDSYVTAYDLFSKLEDKFNRNLFPLSEEEKSIVGKIPGCLNLIKGCFYGEDLVTGQFAMGRIYQFQYIPIELISSIYEEFMSGENEEHNKIREEGAYYTPLMLVEFILNKVLPYPDENNKNFDVKILDPACGSGIFLVESYKRLIARWKYSNQKTKITKEILEDLLYKNIFGIEKDPEAIKITAFSLYLTFLNYVEPREVLQDVRFFKPLIRWFDNKEIKNQTGRRIGNNLFQSSTFNSDLNIYEHNIDLVIGNPPWKRGKGNDETSVYRLQNDKNIPNDIICAYLDFLPKKFPAAKFAILSSAKVLFNSDSKYEKFRYKFFLQNKFDVIINLAVVRNVIFENANAPAVIFIFKSNMKAEIINFITYCIPKDRTIINNARIIIIDNSDIKYLPLAEILKPHSRIFNIAMWGSTRDAMLIERMMKIKSIQETTNVINRGGGLHKKEKKDESGNSELVNHLFINPGDIQSYYIPKKQLLKLGKDHLLYRKNNKKIFSNPLVLLNEGSKESNFCCAYVDFDCVYKSSSYGLKYETKNDKFHKSLVACLNSEVANYFYFLTSGSWGVDRSRVENKEAILFPCLPSIMDDSVISELSERMDEIISIQQNIQFGQDKKAEINTIKERIDKIIYKLLNLTDNDKALIQNVLGYSIALLNRYNKSLAESFVNIDQDLISYCKAVCTSTNSMLKNINRKLEYQIVTNQNTSPLNIVCFRFAKLRTNSNGALNFALNNDVTALLNEINKYVYQQWSESVYYRKIVKYQKENLIYLIKPNQKRFWSISQALNDGDSIILDLIK